MPMALLAGSPRDLQELARGARPLLRVSPASQTERAAEIPDYRANVPTWRREWNTNTPANRMTQTFLKEIQAEAELLSILARYVGDEAAGDAMRTISSASKAWARAPIFQSLSSRILETVAHFVVDPHIRSCTTYRSVMKSWRSLAGSVEFDWSGCPAISADTLEPWHLYEIWCYLQVAQCLKSCAWRITGGDILKSEPRGLSLALMRGKRSQLVFQRKIALEQWSIGRKPRRREESSETDTLALWYQPLFSSSEQFAVFSGRTEVNRENASQGGVRFRSITHAMQPDIAIRAGERLLLLDPKLRAYPGSEPTMTSRPRTDSKSSAASMLNDIDKMHAYRDAIICTNTSRSAVEEAWCLFPGSGGAETHGSITYPTGTQAHPFGTAGIGALTLRPGGSTQPLENLISRWVNTAP